MLAEKCLNDWPGSLIWGAGKWRLRRSDKEKAGPSIPWSWEQHPPETKGALEYGK